MIIYLLLLIAITLSYKCYEKYKKHYYYYDKIDNITFPINKAVYSLIHTPSNSPNSTTPNKPHRLSQTFSATLLNQHIRKRLFVDKNVQTDESSHYSDSS
jgi:hypothetical protein